MGIPKYTIIHANFNDSISVDFKSDGSFNATLAAKYFDKRPNDWLALDETKKYIDALLSNQLQAGTVIEYNQLVISKSGSPENGGGTWLHETLAVAFARWLDIKFGVWCDMQIKGIIRQEKRISQYDAALMAMKFFPSAQKVAKSLGLDKNEAILAANKAVFILTNINTLELLGHGALISESQKQWRNATEIGKLVGVSAQSVNKLLEQEGYQEKVLDTWTATEKANSYCRLFDSGKKHSNGVSIQQLKWCDDIVPVLKNKVEAMGIGQ